MHLYLRKRYKHFKRYKEIANVLTKHGFGYLLGGLGLDEFISHYRSRRSNSKESSPASRARRLRLVLEELGPTFIKLGQILSTRSDILPAEFIAELSKLQDDVPPFPFDRVKESIQLELGAGIEDIFSSFERDPLGAASVGQVHRAVLKNGEKVVVKIQRPGIKAITETDMEIMYDVARLVDRHTQLRKYYNLVEVVEEFDQLLRKELDFTIEGKNMETFNSLFAGDPGIHVPAVKWDYTAPGILTMEYIDGVKLTNLELLDRYGLDKKVIARRLADSLLRQIFVHGFFHADPHPGNLAVLPGEKVVFMDFGIVGRLDEDTRDKIACLVLGIIHRSTSQVIRAINGLGVVPGGTDFAALRRDIERLRQKYYEIPLKEISVSESLGDIMQVAYNYNIRVPTEFTLLVKALITVEGIAVKLDPELSIVEVLEPIGKKILSQRYSIKSLLKLVNEILFEYHGILTGLPRHLSLVLDLISRGEMKFVVENPDQHIVMRQLHIISARLSLSIVTAGLVISAALLTGKGVTFMGLPVEQITFILSILTGVPLLFSILKGI